MRIDEFSATFNGVFSSSERMRFISVGFDIVAAAPVPPTTGALFITSRTLQLIDKTRGLPLIDNSRGLPLIDKTRSLQLI